MKKNKNVHYNVSDKLKEQFLFIYLQVKQSPNQSVDSTDHVIEDHHVLKIGCNKKIASSNEYNQEREW